MVFSVEVKNVQRVANKVCNSYPVDAVGLLTALQGLVQSSKASCDSAKRLPSTITVILIPPHHRIDDGPHELAYELAIHLCDEGNAGDGLANLASTQCDQ